MRKFWVVFFSILVTCIVGISLIVVFSTRETIKITANVMYVNVGEEFALNLTQTNANSNTTITASSSDSSIVSYDNGMCVAKMGGTARVTFTTSNARFRNLYCDVIVGDGSFENPYYISSAEQLASIGRSDSNYSSNAYFKLVNDIDASEYNDGYWQIISEFNGVLDGNGYKIANIVIDNKNDNNVISIENAGIFGIVSANAQIYNLRVDDIYIVGSFVNVGSIAGVSYGTIDKIEVTKAFFDVEAETVGGIVGRLATSDNANRNIATITTSSADVTMGQSQKVSDNGVTYVNTGISGMIGGIAGQNMGGIISNTYSVGKVVLGESNVTYGGIVGENEYVTTSTIDNSTNSYVAPARVDKSYSAITLFSNKVKNYANEAIGGVVGINIDCMESVDNQGVVIELNSNNLCGLYYDKENLNYSTTTTSKTFNGVGKNYLLDNTLEITNVAESAGYVMGYTSNNMKVAANYKANDNVTEIYNTNGTLISTKSQSSTWDFDKVWNLNSSKNNGYPYLTYAELDEEDILTGNHSYIILDTYELKITQGNYETQKATKGLCTITIADANGNIVKTSTATEITIDVVEGFKVAYNSNKIYIYDLNNKTYYTITFAIANNDYKFNSITLDDYTIANNGAVKDDAEVNVWFRNTNHTLTFINANTGKTIKTATVVEGTSIQSYITSVNNTYSQYKVKYNTASNGTGSTYTASSKMPNKDLILYVIYNTTTNDNSSNTDIRENDYNNDNDNYDYSDAYEISDSESWNNYLVRNASNSNATFVITNSFTITTSQKVVNTLAGTLNGNGYTITVRGTLNNFGLIDTVANTGSIKNLKVNYTSAKINSLYNSEYFGGIVNECKGEIEDCSVSGTINFDYTVTKGVAGIVGHLDGNIMDCSNSAKISCPAQFVAGVAAVMKRGEVADCTNSGAITNESTSIFDYQLLSNGTVVAAGIVGYMYTSSAKTVKTNTNSGKIQSSISGANDGGNSGGIVGYLSYGTVTENTNKGAIVSDYQAGGIVCFVEGGVVSYNTNSASITASSTGIQTNSCAGGVVGKVKDGGKVNNNTHSNGSISASANSSYYCEAFAGAIIGGMFFGGSATNNKLSGNVNISATAYDAYVAGGCGIVFDNASFTNCTYPTSWSSNSARYLNGTGYNVISNYNINVSR